MLVLARDRTNNVASRRDKPHDARRFAVRFEPIARRPSATQRSLNERNVTGNGFGVMPLDSRNPLMGRHGTLEDSPIIG
jgi:hypothetical protein